MLKERSGNVNFSLLEWRKVFKVSSGPTSLEYRLALKERILKQVEFNN
jgi:hypothetical protein